MPKYIILLFICKYIHYQFPESYCRKQEAYSAVNSEECNAENFTEANKGY